jgi:23S rRNA G2445 N2-methylase RlmL
MIARRIAPGLHRDFAFSRWPAHHKKKWQTLLDDARTRALASSRVRIMGSDRDKGAIAGATANAERAGVLADVTLGVGPISTVENPGSADGLVATNPPYGVRVGEARALRDLYARFGQVMRERFPGWSVAMYSARENLAAQAALAWSSLFRTTNGGLRIEALYAPGHFLH